MKLEIKQPLVLQGIGRRENQEDSYFPTLENGGMTNNIFVVCDGVGGLNKGEIASSLASVEFGKYFQEDSGSNDATETMLAAFEHTQTAFDKHIDNNPETKGMATTMVATYLHAQGLTILHCGDSRFYHIRHGQIIWQTDDHTVVNDMIKAGIMTEEEAKDSKRNKISRAIQGHKKTEPDIHTTEDLQKNDYFFLCTDGVSGSIADADLCQILAGEESNTEKLKVIEELCEANSADNYTAFLLQVNEIYEPDATQPPAEIKEAPKPPENKPAVQTPENKRIEESKPKYVITRDDRDIFTKLKSKFDTFFKK